MLCLFLVACQERPVAPEHPEGSVIATIDRENILASELERQIERIQQKTSQVPSTHQQKKELLEQLINIELIYQEALRQNFNQRFEFKSRLAEVYIEDLAAKSRANLKENQLRDFYAKNKSQFDQIAARHILLKTKTSMSEKEKVAIFQKLEKYREHLVKNPEDFDEYARQYSEDSTARQGGDLGFFNFTMMDPAFAKAAFQLKEINEISGIVPTRFGYHLIQLRGDRRGFEHHINFIRDQMVRDVQKRILDEEIEKLRSAKNIQIYEDELLKLSPLPDLILTDPDEIIPEDVKPQGPKDE